MSRISDIINDHLKFLVAIGVGAALIMETTNSWPSVELPAWTELAAMLVVLGVVAGYFAAGKIWDLLPEQRGIFIPCIEAENTEKIELWELTEDQWEDLTVEDGTLNELPECKYRAYEAVSYDPETNTAVGTWRKSKANSELVGHNEVSDAIEEIAELRGAYERIVRRGDKIYRRIGSIIRVLDRERARDQNRALEGHTTPSLGGRTVEDVIDDQLGDLAPGHLKNDDQTDEEAIADDLIDDDLGSLAGEGDGEALEPEPASGDD